MSEYSRLGANQLNKTTAAAVAAHLPSPSQLFGHGCDPEDREEVERHYEALKRDESQNQMISQWQDLRPSNMQIAEAGVSSRLKQVRWGPIDSASLQEQCGPEAFQNKRGLVSGWLSMCVHAELRGKYCYFQDRAAQPTLSAILIAFRKPYDVRSRPLQCNLHAPGPVHGLDLLLEPSSQQAETFTKQLVEAGLHTAIVLRLKGYLSHSTMQAIFGSLARRQIALQVPTRFAGGALMNLAHAHNNASSNAAAGSVSEALLSRLKDKDLAQTLGYIGDEWTPASDGSTYPVGTCRGIACLRPTVTTSPAVTCSVLAKAFARHMGIADDMLCPRKQLSAF